MAQPEFERVERPLIKQLVAMGWAHLCGADPGRPATDPDRTDRSDFTRTHYPERFRAAVSRINPGPDGEPWLTEPQLDRLLRILTDASISVRGNLVVTRHLRDGVNARLLPGWQPGDPEHVRLVDWDSEFPPGEGNDLLAVSQFRVEHRDVGPATPDLVLFVNGLPWVVIECKAYAGGRFTLDAAVEQVLGYAGARAASPVPDFLRFGQLLVGTNGEHAELATVTAEPRHFALWHSVEPATEAQVRQETDTAEGHDLTAQAVLVAGALRPAHLLHLVRDFTTTAGSEAHAVKVVGRYQQFRAVKRLASKLRDRLRDIAAGRRPDQRGGVVWHTQGSGKSLTMAFLVRHVRCTPVLAGHKVVVVTDRLDLEKQIRESLGAAEEHVHRARSVEEARHYLAVDVPDLVLVTIQKSRRDDAADDGTEESLGEEPDEETRLHNRVANASPQIIVLIDEAHRGHGAWQHARLRAMLPNATLIGFTGTPVISGQQRSSREVFGDFADVYSLRDAERDRAVVPVRYEAYGVPLDVVERAALDARFDEEVPQDPERRRRVLERFARRKEVLESPAVIAVKARHMLRHWARNGLPDGFGAQIVAVSRKAAVAYREALLTARNALVAELDALDPDILHDPMAEDYLTDEQRELLYVLPQRDLLAAVDAAVVISEAEGNTDPAAWRTWQLKSRQDAYIERFKRGIATDSRFLRAAGSTDPAWRAETHGAAAMPQNTGPGTATGEPWHEPAADPGPAKASGTPPAEADGGDEPLAFLVVNSMLLTGFDAPVEQAMYLDRAITGVNLLQAIARTNRRYPAKLWGQVVDYVGIGPELATALAAYDREHLRQVYGYADPTADHLLPDYEGEQPTGDRPWLQTDAAADRLLADARDRVMALVRDRAGVSSLDGAGAREDLLAALAEPELRGEFDEFTRDYLTALNAVLPRPQALVHEALARQLGEVQYLARRRYLDDRDQFSPRRYGAKVRQLIARHLEANGVDQRIPPVEISAQDFMARVNANPDARARASYMAGRLRLHIDARLGSDPVTYERFSQRLDAIVWAMEQDFEAAASSLEDLVGRVREAGEETQADDGLDPLTERPVYGLLERALRETGRVPPPPGVDLFQASRDVCVELAGAVRPPHFEQLASTRERVYKQLRNHLEETLAMEWDDTGNVAGELVELARVRRTEFLRYGRPRTA